MTALEHLLGNWPGDSVDVELHICDLDVEALEAERKRAWTMAPRFEDVHRSSMIAREQHMANVRAMVDAETRHLVDRLALPIRIVQLTNVEADIRSNSKPRDGDGSCGFAPWSPGIPTASVSLHYTVSR